MPSGRPEPAGWFQPNHFHLPPLWTQQDGLELDRFAEDLAWLGGLVATRSKYVAKRSKVYGYVALATYRYFRVWRDDDSFPFGPQLAWFGAMAFGLYSPGWFPLILLVDLLGVNVYFEFRK